METGGGMAMAHAPVVQMDGSCAGMQHSSPDEKKSDLQVSCAIACAALPGTSADFGHQTLAPRSADVVLPEQVLAGIWPEGETPPPRIASEI